MGLWSTELTGGVLVATYTCAPMNYMCGEGISELAQLIETWREPEIRAVVLTGGLPGRFVTHYSAEELLHIMEDPEMLRAIGPAASEAYYGVLHALEQLPKPVVAAINGDAMGGGLEICLACDLRICQSGDYRLGLLEVKVGLIPGGGGTQRLPRIVGLGRSLDLILRGRLLRPEEALSFGLVHEVVDDALARAREIAKELAGLSPVALACAKHAVYAGADVDLKSGLSIEAEAFLRAASSDDARAASRAYVAVPFEKRRGWMESPKGVRSGRS